MSCRKCGNVLKCDNCTVNYTYHSMGDHLCCHYCGKRTVNPSLCPACGSKFIKYFGVGTQKVERELSILFPGADIIRMDTDTTSGKDRHRELLSAFRKSRGAVLLGTQMITKGLDFPEVTLVGIIAADLSLFSGDFRAGESTFQLLAQVAGRSGRAESPGRVFIQTYNPSHYAVKFAKNHDYESFYSHEIVVRRQMMYPPFTHVFSVLLSGEDERNVIVLLNKLHEIMKYCNRNGLFEILGPAPALVAKVKKKFRWKLILKCEEEERLKRFAFYCVNKLREHDPLKDVGVHMTMDPIFLE